MSERMYVWVLLDFFAVLGCWMGATDFEWEDGLVDYFVQILDSCLFFGSRDDYGSYTGRRELAILASYFVYTIAFDLYILQHQNQ